MRLRFLMNSLTTYCYTWAPLVVCASTWKLFCTTFIMPYQQLLPLASDIIMAQFYPLHLGGTGVLNLREMNAPSPSPDTCLRY
ncbi:hypothetical protein BDZ94DRAFT_1269664 [Collybia nuda]|uniref:Uncharacterized protein n=1 Tax=Collybia nuda TaxID=64659 RepID=A0A9P5Y033_9AGAR|nr:hypothetical protein BDZ94DRAFT_1269664 [Collybia nuda]